MAYIGYNPSQLAVAPFAVKSFTGDGSTTTFTLDQSVPGANEANVEVVVENVQQNPIDAYTIGGDLNNSLIFSEAPASGAAIYVIHKGEATYNLQPSTGSVTAATLDPVLRNFTVDNFTGNGSATTFTMTDTPYSANSILVTVDGIVQTASTNYTVSGTTLSFGTSAPDSGAIITVVHLGFSSGNKAVMDGSITPVKLSTGGLYWNTSGQVSIGNTTPRGVGGSIRALTIEGIGPSSQGISLIRNSADASASFIMLTKTRGTAINANNAVTSGDSLGNIYFYGADGTTSSSAIGAAAALIVGQVDGTVSTGVVPGRLVFQTASSAGTLTERMRIDSRGKVAISATPANWKSTWPSLDIGQAASFYSQDNNTTGIGSNLYFTGSVWGRKTLGAAALYQLSEGGHYWYSNPSGAADSTFSPTTIMQIENSGILTLPYGQIKFPAAQNASSDANTLDDYEEGTFTPSYSSSGISGIVYGTGRHGYYTKVGRLVTVNINIMTNSVTVTNSSADVTISGLPFAHANEVENSSAGAIGSAVRWAVNTPKTCQITPGSSNVRLFSTAITTAEDETLLRVSDMVASGSGNRNSCRLTITYYV